MSDVELNGLKFEVQADVQEASNSLNQLANTMQRLKSSIKGNGLSSLSNALRQIASVKLDSGVASTLGNLGDALNKLSNVKISGTIASNIKAIADSANGITDGTINRVERLASALQGFQGVQMPTLKNLSGTPTMNSAASAPTPISESPIKGTNGANEVGEVTDAINKASDSGTGLQGVLSKIGGGIKSAFGTGIKTLGSFGISIAKDAIAPVTELGQKIGGGLVSQFSNLFTAPISGLGMLGNAFSGAKSAVDQFLTSVGRIAMYRAIRSFFSLLANDIKAGVNNLYEFSVAAGNSFAPAMDSLATSAQYLKNSMGAMAAPLIEAVAPAVDFLIGKFVTLLNVINQFFARLTGKSYYTRAKKQTVSYGSTISGVSKKASSAGKKTSSAAKKASKAVSDGAKKSSSAVKKAAKEIKNATLGIDELNIISQNENDDSSPSGGGSGGSGGGSGYDPSDYGGGGSGVNLPDYGSMFETVPIDSDIKAFTDQLKAAIEAGDWKSVGTLLGNKFNELVDSFDWNGWGHKVGYGINGAIQSTYWFLKTADFKNLGKRIAEFFNGALDEIDFTYVGKVLVRGITDGIDLVINFLGELDWGTIAKGISDSFKGAFDEVTEWLNEYDWQKVGAKLWENIKDAFTHFDFGGVANSFFTMLGTAIRSAALFLAGFFGDIGVDVQKWWNTSIKGKNWVETAQNLLEAIGKGFFNIAEFVQKNIIDPFMNALIGKDQWKEVKKVALNIMDGLAEGINEFFQDPFAFVSKYIVKPLVNAVKSLLGIHSPSTVFEEIGGYIIEGLFNGLLKPFKDIGNWVNQHIIQPLVGAFNKNPESKLNISVNLIKNGWKTVSGWIGKIPGVEQAVSLAKKAWKTVSDWIGKIPTLSQAIQLVKNGWKNVKTWIGNIPSLQQLIHLVKNGWNTVKSWIGNIPSLAQLIHLVKNGWSSVASWIGNIPSLQQLIHLAKNGWSSVVAWVNQFIGGTVGQGVGLVKNGWRTVADWVRGAVGGVVQIGVSLVKHGWDSFKSFFGLKNGGSIDAHGIHMFADGGIITRSMWRSIPKYAGGTNKAHGSMFVAGEHGAEIVGHINGTTEVLNRFQLASTMHSAIVSGMQLFTPVWNAMYSQIAVGANAIINSVITSADTLDRSLATAIATPVPAYASVQTDTAAMSNTSADNTAKFEDAMQTFYSTYVEPTLREIASDAKRQADKKEKTVVQIGNRTITDAVTAQKKADGFSFTS